MANQKKNKVRRVFQPADRMRILGDLVPGVKLAAVARKHNVGESVLHAWKKANPEWVGKAFIEQKASPSPPAEIPAPPANGVNGHSKTDPPPASARLEITGLRGFVRESVRTELREIVREELAVMLGRVAAP